MMHQESVNAPITILEWMDENESEGRHGCCHDWVVDFIHDSLRQSHPRLHEFRYVLGSRANEMHLFAESADR